MRKLTVVLGLVLLATFAGLSAYLGRPDPPGPGVTWANAARIQVGMTEAEVVAIIGTQPASMSNYLGPDMIHENEPPNARWVLLGSADRDLIVYLDPARRVIGKCVNGAPPPTWPDRARRRLGP